MVTRDQLDDEQVFRDEYIPRSLGVVRSELLHFFDWPTWRVGIIGDVHHLWGGHRSRNWILNSRYCTNRTRTVTETEGNRTGGNGNEIAAMDIVTTETLVRAMADRVNGARRAGRLPYVREVIIESGPWHLHLTFDRGMLDFGPDTLLSALTGQNSGGQKMITVLATMPELAIESEGADVVTWQTLANLRGATLKVDGEFGPLTDAATREIQTRYGAESVDGQVGPETWAIGLAGEDQQ